MKKSPIFLEHLQNRKWRKQMTMILLPTEVGDGSFVWVCLWWTSWLLDNKIARELFMMLWWKNILHQEERQVKDILLYIFQWLRWVNCVRILRYNTTFPQRFPKLITRILYPESHCTHPEGENPTSALLYKMAGGTQSLIISHQTVKGVTFVFLHSLGCLVGVQCDVSVRWCGHLSRGTFRKPIGCHHWIFCVSRRSPSQFLRNNNCTTLCNLWSCLGFGGKSWLFPLAGNPNEVL